MVLLRVIAQISKIVFHTLFKTEKKIDLYEETNFVQVNLFFSVFQRFDFILFW